MGFFTGAYLKIMTGKMRRSMENRLADILRQANQVARQIGNVEKNLQSMENAMKNSIKSESIFAMQQKTQGMFADASKYMQDQQNFTQIQAFSQQWQAMRSQQVEQMMEMYRATQLDPLKDKEDALATEKANLESRIKLLEGQEKLAQDMEQKGAKDLAPDSRS